MINVSPKETESDTPRDIFADAVRFEVTLKKKVDAETEKSFNEVARKLWDHLFANRFENGLQEALETIYSDDLEQGPVDPYFSVEAISYRDEAPTKESVEEFIEHIKNGDMSMFWESFDPVIVDFFGEGVSESDIPGILFLIW